MTNGTLSSGTAAFAAGKFGNALTGGATYTIGDPETGTTWTAEAWIKSTATNGPLMFLAHEGYWYMSVDGATAGNARARCTIGSGYASNIYGPGTNPVNDGAWHHVAMVVNAGVATVYVDGVKGDSVTATGTLTDTTKSTTIGALTSTGGYLFTNGQIDEVRISSTARYTAAFSAPTAAFTDDANTLALYHLEADATDSHVAGGGGTLTSTVAPAVTPTSSITTGTVLTTTNGTWSATPDSYTYQWNRAGSAISGATSSTYTVVSADAGQAITCTVTAIKATYTSGTATSNTVTPAAATTTITATDAGFIYSPYNWNVASGVATTINPGAYVRATFTGATAVTLNFDMTGVSTPVPKLKIRVDDGPWVVYDCAATITPTMPATNAWTVHHVELVVQSTSEFLNRWTPQNAVVKFTGFTLNATGAALRTAVPLGKNVLIYGDSITEGYKTLLNVTTPDGSDATVAWSSLQRAQLGVEVGVVGFGAQGWLSGGQGGVPALPSSYNLLYSGVSRSFTLAPDLIVINMGQNDSSDITSVTTTFLNTLLALNTTTKIALMLPFSGAHAAQLQAAQAACATPSRVTYIDTTGWWNSADSFDGVHPEGVASQSSLAPRLANALRPLLAGTVTPKRYVNVGGTAKAIA